MRLPNSTQHTIATSYLIGRSALDHSVFGIHALSNGLAPVGRDDLMGRFGAAPDGLALVPGRERGHDADWVEVVVRDRPQTEFERIFAIARSVSWLDPEESIRLNRMLLLFDTQLPTEQTIVKALRQHLSKNPTVGGSPFPLILVRCRIGFPFVWKGFDEVDYTRVLRQHDSDPKSRDIDADGSV